MKGYQFSGPSGMEALSQVDLPEPALPPEHVRVRMDAWSLNYRDLAMPGGGYFRNDKIKTSPPLIPLSDGAGTVVEIGTGVSGLDVGDRVATCFFQDWVCGDVTESQMSSALGGAIDGVLAEQVVLHEGGVVTVPEHLSQSEAACLPCAALTAWQALTLAHLQAGQTILTLGTGGVSIFALQLAKMFGARVIITSSSDEKLERAKQLGADIGINYRNHPEWHEQVREATGGVGVDNVIEVGGLGTLERSLQAARVSGTVSLIGILTGDAPPPSPLLALFNRLTIRGIYVGSREMFEAMNRAIEVGGLRPVIDRSFGFDALEDIRAAYEYLRSGRHFGKVVIER